MCGRTACTLGPENLCRACQYRDRDGALQKPRWKDGSSQTGGCKPSYNFCPGSFGAVLVAASHFPDKPHLPEDRLLVPMKWGLVPSWHKGPSNEFAYKMVNARCEGIMDKASFRTPLQKGRRCVFVADGFYEWQKTAGLKQPYFVHFPQKSALDFSAEEKCPYSSALPSSKLESENLTVKLEPSKEVEEISKQKNVGLGMTDRDEEGWTGRRLLTMAAVFDISHPPDCAEPLLSYAVITVPPSSTVAFMHDRMPAILDGSDAVNDWLDYENVPLQKALKLLVPCQNVEYYGVSTAVNNPQNKGPNCIEGLKPKKVEEKVTSSSTKHKLQGTLLSYMNVESKKKKSD